MTHGFWKTIHLLIGNSRFGLHIVENSSSAIHDLACQILKIWDLGCQIWKVEVLKTQDLACQLLIIQGLEIQDFACQVLNELKCLRCRLYFMLVSLPLQIWQAQRILLSSDISRWYSVSWQRQRATLHPHGYKVSNILGRLLQRTKQKSCGLAATAK